MTNEVSSENFYPASGVYHMQNTKAGDWGWLLGQNEEESMGKENRKKMRETGGKTKKTVKKKKKKTRIFTVENLSRIIIRREGPGKKLLSVKGKGIWSNTIHTPAEDGKSWFWWGDGTFIF